MSIKISQTNDETKKVFTFEQLEDGVLYKINGLPPYDNNNFDCFPEVYTRIGDSLVYFHNGKVYTKEPDLDDKFIEAPRGTTVTLTND